MQAMALSLCLGLPLPVYIVSIIHKSCVTVQDHLYFPQIRKDQMNINLAWGAFFAAGFVNTS